ncbi:translational GTPase TypA [Actinomyces sp. F1_1611]
MPVRPDLRNVAIVAHVDHGKTTLVDAMLWQAGAFSSHQTAESTGTRVMDSGDLEREKGITILAKNTAVNYAGPAAQELGLDGGVVINVVDTPGHADFGGEVERALSMVDGVVLLVDASEGPLPQTRFVLSKALRALLPVILVVNKVDRPDSRIDEVVQETSDLLLSLAEDSLGDGYDVDIDRILEVPVVYASAKAGLTSLNKPDDGDLPDNDMEPLFRTILEAIPGPHYVEGAPLQAQVTNLDASPFLGRLALVRVHNGELHRGDQVAWVRPDGDTRNVRIAELLRTEGLERVPSQVAGPGDIVAVAGIPEITIGDSLVDKDDPHPLPGIIVDDPAISMTIGINTSPMAGRVKGAKVTARALKERLEREMVGNVSLRVLPTDRPDAWEVQGRGELALAILVEQMRREGYEMTVGKPTVVTRMVDGKLHEPMERLTVDIPEEYLGAVTQLLAERKGRLETMSNHGTGWMRLEFVVPARGLIGFRTQFLTDTRGTGIQSSIAAGYEPWAGDIEQRKTGSLVADRPGQATPYAMLNLQERASFIVEPGSEVYEGQVVGENPRNEDMDVNITREKKQTNMRSASADVYESLTPSRKLSLEEALEFAAEDECVEVTPESVRVRKVELNAQDRFKIAARKRRANK